MEQTAPAGRRPLETQVAMGGDAVRHGAWGLLQVQLLSGMGASVVSALALTPFDVVKTRIQMLDGAIGCGHHGSLALHGCCVHPAAVLGGKELRPGAVQTVRCMVRNEGLHSLWRGSAFSTVAAVPSVGIYMAIYEQIKAKLQTSASGHERSWAPLVSGASARSLATIFTSPLELVRVRLMAERGKQSSGPFAIIRAAVRESGWVSLWKGIGPSLYRDVPFSAIYWMLAETLRGRLRGWANSGPSVTLGVGPKDAVRGDLGRIPVERVLWVNLVAGAAAGAAAAVVTHPFDVVKTQVQVENSLHPKEPVGSFKMLRQIVEHGGWGSMFKGLLPRVLKVAPSCAIVLGSFEVFKTLL